MKKTRTQTDGTSPTLLWSALGALVAFYATVLVRWADNFFADDSYFYFQVASRLAGGLGSSFNGLMTTNGYHPLWLLVCAAVLWIVPDHGHAVHAIAVVIALLNLSALVNLTLVLRRAGTQMPYLVWLLYLPFCFTSQLGTEGALSGALVAGTLLVAYVFACRPSPGLACGYALSAGLAVLSRLDNVFLIAAVSGALVLGVPRSQRRTMLQLLAMAAPIVVLLWAAYLYSNMHFFGTLQPISGMLKAHSRGEHRLFTNLPRTAWLDLGFITVGLAVVARWQRDLFFRVVELPVACGVLVHALYIAFVLSSETRWSWYYTTWMLLASILMTRAGSMLFGWFLQRLGSSRTESGMQAVEAGTLRNVVFTMTYLVLLGVWWGSSLRRFGHNDPGTRDPGFQVNVVERAKLHTLLAFDKPGRIAYYSTADIVPLDGLMGSVGFQRDLAASGIGAFDRANRVDGFIGPPQPLDDDGKRAFCDAVFLSSVQFHCVAAGPHAWTVDRAEVFARLTQTPAGFVKLNLQNIVFNQPGYVAVWRLPAVE